MDFSLCLVWVQPRETGKCPYMTELVLTGALSTKISKHTDFDVSSWIYKRGLYTVNSEIFARILFSRIGLKHIFATLKIHDKEKIYLYQ